MPSTVGIVGAGPAGIAAARACLERHLSVTLFDTRSHFGGIWTYQSTPVFDDLTTNTACFETAFSDSPPLRVTPHRTLNESNNLCLTRKELHEYLVATASKTPRLSDCLRSNRNVVAVRACDEGYKIQSVANDISSGEDGERHVFEDKFDYVIIASGVHNVPITPTAEAFPGLDDFPGDMMHVQRYKNPGQFRGKHVLIVGGSISGCETAGNLAMASPADRPASVTLSSRRIRYLLKKQTDGRLLISEISTRFLNYFAKAGLMWSDEYEELMLEKVLSFSKNEDYNAPAPNVPLHEPRMPNWVPVSHELLQASKLGLLDWDIGGISSINKDGVVQFKSGKNRAFDVILFAIGYRLDLPFLDEETKKLVLSEDAPQFFMNLAHHTLHPELPHLTFVGLYHPGSAAPPMADAQARWIARMIAEPCTRPTKCEQRAAIEAFRKERMADEFNLVVFGCDVLDRFAELAGFDVDLSVYPEWTKALIFGPLVPAQFRLFGEGKLQGALAEFERQITAAGFLKGDNFVEEHKLEQLRKLCGLLQKVGNCPKSLPKAVEFLLRENGMAT